MNYVTLDDYEARNLAISDPKYFLDQYKYPLIIDEIQYAPNLLSYIKIIVDQKKFASLKDGTKVRQLFRLTGSQSFNMMDGISDSLAGRIKVLKIYSLTLDEMLNKDANLFLPKINLLKTRNIDCSLDTSQIFKYIFNGSMPEVFCNNTSRDIFYSSYVSTYIERDIKQLLNVGKTNEFYRFMQYIAVRTAQEINYSSISKEVGVDQKTIKKRISILEASGIIYLLQPYYSNLTNRIIKAQKLYFMDTGLCSFLAKYPTPETLEVGALSGAIFETFVVSEIIKNFTNFGLDPRLHLYFYRDKDQKEIDLIFEDGDTLIPIEIKKGVSPSSPNKSFGVLNKFNKNIGEGLIICMAKKLTPLNKNCWLCPLEYI